jgi:superfamily I DNA/RNA helicase
MLQMRNKPTEEQELIIEAAVNTPDNLMVSALAGAAKTSTLVLLAEALSNVQVLCLAFNKKIATEMQERLPVNCTAMTLNSLGHRVWADVLSKRLVVEVDKNFKILTQIVKELPKYEQEQAYAEFADTLKMIESGKSAGYIPTGHFTNAKRLMDDSEFFACLEDEPSPLQEKIVREATLKSIKQGMDGLIDFSDQILLPTVFPSMFPHYALVMVDEAQDLSALNHATLRKLAKRRLIAVGDECQAIYGFRGAHEESMGLLGETFKMRKLILSISFRCPKTVVAEALWRAPHMKFPEWAKDGEVKKLTEWNKDTVPQTAAIICRNNAPLFNMAIKLLKNGRYPQIIGNDIGKYLVKIMKKFGEKDLEKPEVFIAIDKWVEEKLKKSRSPAKVYDQAECLKIFAAQGETLGDAIAYAEHIFNSQGPIQLLTGHKSKGLEFDTVFFLDEHLIDIEQGQERNLRYVIQTRAKQSLYYVTSETFEDEMENT